MIRRLLIALFVLVLIQPDHHALALPTKSLADSPPSLEFIEIANGLSSPTSITNAGDSSGRLFITQLDGQIMIYDGTQLLNTPFLDISSLVVSGSEQGLLSVAFHPNYESNGYFYVFYTRISDGALVIARYHVSANPNVSDGSSALIIKTIPHPGATNHNGGQLQFGSDGYLYISTGDGGTGGAHSQEGNSLLGKILRIDVNSGSPYAIPANNPFVSDATVADEVWALGLRNPWRFSFDSLSGDLMIADVGQSTWEEVNVRPSSSTGGENYGWPCYEGLHNISNPSACTKGTITQPITEYNHSFGCSISGGYRYRGSKYPNLYGVYLYGDYCSGRIWGAEPNGNTWTAVNLIDTDFGISTFGEGEDRNLYVADYFSGRIYSLQTSIFSDVPTSYWAWQYIQSIYQAGITGGCNLSPFNYCPESPVTRAQMAIFLLRGIHNSSYSPPGATGTVFNDISVNSFAAAWVEQLSNEGITAGCGNGNYCPDISVTRAQMAIFLLRAKYGASYSPPPATGSVFVDVPSNAFAAAWIEKMVSDGITAGCGSGNYCPNSPVTRAQMAVFLQKTFNLP